VGIGSAVIRPLKNALDDMPVHVRQLSDMFRRHGQRQNRTTGRVNDLDAAETRTPQIAQPSGRPGFHADGTINPADFRTPRDGAYYWSGMYPRNGEEIAGRIASSNNATTLEMLIDSRGIEMPEWDADNPAVVETWTRASEAYAAGASGEVRAVLGDNLRPDAVWWTELDRLKANDDVTRVIRVDPDTLAESVIWPE
jgi:hypothetical protein